MAPPSGGPPPVLAPSVEAAYRAKCIQLKQRLNEVEESNDAARLRLARTDRMIQKQRLERAFLLEQLAKRTSTNVEDSEGSPSPPPTPKEKPLRTKRGHRKPDFLNDVGDGRPGSTFIQQNPATISPSSDAFSHTHPDPHRNSTPQGSIKRNIPSNGTHPSTVAAAGSNSSQPRRPKNAFDLFCNETRPALAEQHKEDLAAGTYNIEAALAQGWSTLDTDSKDEFTLRFEQIKRSTSETEGRGPRAVVFDAAPTDDGDEDVEMADEVGTPAAEAGGFTAVNRG